MQLYFAISLSLLKRTLLVFNETRQYNIKYFNKSILLICFCSFDLFCPLLEKYTFIENVYIVLSFLIK